MMSEEEENKERDDLGSTGLVRFINSLHEIKLPEIVKKNVMTATGKLIMGAVDIPVAWMESKAKQIRSETDALGKVTEASGISTAQAFNVDPELQARSIDYWGSKLLKKELNREKVYWQAMQDLEKNPPEEDSDNEIDEDWLEQFGSLAESKSDKKTQLILSKILAGEIRNSGSFSPRTLEAIKLLDSKTAKIFHYYVSTSITNHTGIHYMEAAKNFSASPFSTRISALNADRRLIEFGLITPVTSESRDLLYSRIERIGIINLRVEEKEKRHNISSFLHEMRNSQEYVDKRGLGQFTVVGLEIMEAMEFNSSSILVKNYMSFINDKLERDYELFISTSKGHKEIKYISDNSIEQLL